MKKALILLLAFAMALSLCGCGKTEAAKNVEASIDALLATENAGSAEIAEVKAAYDALTADEQKTVKNYSDFVTFRDKHYETALVGTWYPFSLALQTPEYIYNLRYSITLKDDMTYVTANADYSSVSGAWEISQGKLFLQGISHLQAETGSGYWNKDYLTFRIEYADGKDQIVFEELDEIYYQLDDYLASLEGIVLDINCAKDDLSQYLGFTSYTIPMVDQWGASTGGFSERVCLKNLLYEQGWTYIGTSQDILLEVLYPEYTVYSESDGSTYETENSAGSFTVSFNPFEAGGGIDLKYSDPLYPYTYTTDLTPDSFSFGRAKGHIYFLNSKYVKDVHKSENGLRILDLDITDSTSFLGNELIYAGTWTDYNWEY